MLDCASLKLMEGGEGGVGPGSLLSMVCIYEDALETFLDRPPLVLLGVLPPMIHLAAILARGAAVPTARTSNFKNLFQLPR